VSVAYIPVSNTEFAIVDLEDVPRLFSINTRWSTNNCKYPQTWCSRQKKVIHAHHVIVGKGFDHINRDRLDNRKCNLREATFHQNMFNRVRKNPTGYRGVYKSGQNFYAALSFSKSTIYLGAYVTAFEAALAYDRAMTEWAGEYGVYNFG
jgi:hypothetical protein